MTFENLPTLNISEVLSQAWRHFVKNWVAWVVSGLAVIAAVFAVVLVGVLIMVSTSKTTTTATSAYTATVKEEPSAVGMIALLLTIIVAAVLAVIYAVNVYRNAYRSTQGEEITIKDFFNTSNIATPLITIALLYIILTVAFFMLVIPYLIASVVLMYVPIAAVSDPKITVGEAFSRGIATFKANAGQSVLLMIVLWLIVGVATATWIGALIATPVMYLSLAVAYRICRGETFATLNN